jgi:outer membrane protein assembly factor BamE (lipoprotein component of BamABCDE complex)
MRDQKAQPEVVMIRKITLAILVCTQLGACANNSHLASQPNRFVSIGMSSDEVAEIMGSPMAVNTDASDMKSWAYHELKADIRYARGPNCLSSILTTGHFAYATEAQSNMPRPPKFVVNFDNENRVESYAYLVKATRAATAPAAIVASAVNTGIF